ncbi:MAG: branched-chain alpha-keto acid dehydrogenase subunit E2, partial [Gammaproteobacteria bacterium]|nr:branched-chain alpha-keto acid dehydrogenase subunit E2 [Gammaproteobacteria bacterium]
MSIKEIFVPDIGSFKDVEVIEILVKVGDTIAADSSVMTVESDKAAMDIPAPSAGKVTELKIKVGDKVSAGSPMLMLDTSGEAAASSSAPVVKSFTPAATPVVANVPPPSHPAPEVPAHIPPKHRPDPVAAHAEFAGGKPAHASPAVRR